MILTLAMIALSTTGHAASFQKCRIATGYPRTYCMWSNTDAREYRTQLVNQNYREFLDGEESEVLISRSCTGGVCTNEYLDQKKMVLTGDYSRQKTKKPVLVLVRETIRAGVPSNSRRELESLFVPEAALKDLIEGVKKTVTPSELQYQAFSVGMNDKQGYGVAAQMSLRAFDFIRARAEYEKAGYTSVIPAGSLGSGTYTSQVNLTKTCVDTELQPGRQFYECRSDYLVSQAMTKVESLSIDDSLEIVPAIVDVKQKVDDQFKDGYYVQNTAQAIYVLSPSRWTKFKESLLTSRL